MSNAISAIFGKKPSTPAAAVVKQRNIEKVSQDVQETEKESILAQFAKRKRATYLSNLSDAMIGKRKLGAG